MKTSRSFWMLFGLILLVGCGANENFKTGLELNKNNRWDDAITYFEKALQESPGNKEFKDALLQAKQASAKSKLDKVKEALSADKDPIMPTLERVLKDVDATQKRDPDNKEIKAFQDDLNSKIAALKVQVKTLLAFDVCVV